MRIKWIRILILSICFSFILGCDNTPVNNPYETVDNESPALSPANDKLVIWSYYGGWEYTIEHFEAKYPDVNVEVELFNYDEYLDMYINALLSGEGPDIMVTHSVHMKEFTAIEGLVDLAESPYNAEEHKNDFPDGLWNSQYSFDGLKLIGMPLSISPMVTFYRADILEQYGFPTDPEELGNYIENPRHWIEIAKALRKDDKYIMQWAPDFFLYYSLMDGLLDNELRSLHHSTQFLELIDLSKVMNEANLYANLSVWSDQGEKAVQSGKLALLILGTWGVDQIKAWAPETEGKWRVTRLPFGMHAWEGSPILSVPSQSRNKEMAWKFIEYAATEHVNISSHYNTVPAYIPARNQKEDLQRPTDFLGGQRAYALYEALTDQMSYYRPTPLDSEVFQIWTKLTMSGIENNLNKDFIIESIEDEIEQQLGKERNILLQQLTDGPR